MTTCNAKGCSGEALWVRFGFCEECWQKLPQEDRKAILSGRQRSVRAEAEAITQARRWLQEHA
jgi:hypothetical protein